MAWLAIFTSTQLTNAQISSKNGGFWYRGNTHTHARFSDENDDNDVPLIASWYARSWYYFLLLSEHNDHLNVTSCMSRLNSSTQQVKWHGPSRCL